MIIKGDSKYTQKKILHTPIPHFFFSHPLLIQKIPFSPHSIPYISMKKKNSPHSGGYPGNGNSNPDDSDGEILPDLPIFFVFCFLLGFGHVQPHKAEQRLSVRTWPKPCKAKHRPFVQAQTQKKNMKNKFCRAGVRRCQSGKWLARGGGV